MARSVFLLLLSSIVAAASVQAQEYESTRASFKTHLVRPGPSPQSYERAKPPRRVSEVEYQSGALKLKAWLALPTEKHEPFSAIIFLHGGFSFSLDDYKQAQPFLDAGYAVMFPFLRGENGNPGNFELMYGEVDDALAAARWLRKHRGIDPARVSIFGHSVGGAIAELTSLSREGPLLLSGSVGALYPPQIFQSWKGLAPFDTTQPKEVVLRVFVMNLSSMRRRHVAYLGNEEPQVEFVKGYREQAAKHSAPLSISIVPGDHESAVAPAMKAFLVELQSLSR